MDYVHYYSSPLGGITITSDGLYITGLWFDDQKYSVVSSDCEHEEKSLPIFEETDLWLDIYFSGREPDFTPPLFMNTTDFRKMVWEILLTIPYGSTVSYGEIAERIANQMNYTRMSAQAVGGAVSHNPISIIIPCHRVISANGSLTGYAGGIDRKAKLLNLESKQHETNNQRTRQLQFLSDTAGRRPR